MDSVQKEAHVVSGMTDKHKETCAVVRDEKDDRLLQHQIRRQTDEGGEKSSNTGREESSTDKRSRIPCRNRNCKNPSCRCWHSPVCQNYKSETRCICGRNCFFRQAEEKPSKKWISCSTEGFHVKKENWDQITPSNFPRAPGTKIKFRKERVHREESKVCES